MNKQALFGTKTRISLWYGILLLVLMIFFIRLFYLQIIKHDHYRRAAEANQLKQYEIPAARGEIFAELGGEKVPLVLNQERFTIYADPQYVIEPDDTATKVQTILGGDASKYAEKMRVDDSRYQVLAKQVTKAKKQQLLDLKLKGIGAQAVSYRTYPQGSLASQLLGFVNEDGAGRYGIEEALNDNLTGTPGQLKAITDVTGVPLAANQSNTLVEPTRGDQLSLTIDMGMQSQLEEILKQGLKDAKSDSGSALILEVKTGAIKAMANFPTYNPDKYYEVDKPDVFNNSSVSSPLEVGSVMKPLTAAAALDRGVVSPGTTYYDPAVYEVDGYKITNIEEDGGAATRSVADILQLSLNTGATWLLMQMGGGQLSENGRVVWHNYMTNHYQLGKPTGIEQGYEAPGVIPDPVEGFALNLKYANTSFGQGITATPLQMGAALASIVNGGTYYKPHLVHSIIDANGNENVRQPEIVKSNVVSPQTSQQIVALMENVINKNYIVYKNSAPRPEYSVGGKTGTAEIANPDGGYFEDRFNGMFTGFVGGDEVKYVIVVRVNAPKIDGYAGSQAAAPIFGRLSDMLINNFNVEPRL